MISSYIMRATNLHATVVGQPSAWSFASEDGRTAESQDVVFAAYIQAAGEAPESGVLLCLESQQGFAPDEWHPSPAQAMQAAAQYFPGIPISWTDDA